MSRVVKLTLLACGTFASVSPSLVPLLVPVLIGWSVLNPLEVVPPPGTGLLHPETEFEAVEGSLSGLVTEGVVCEGGAWVCSDGVLGERGPGTVTDLGEWTAWSWLAPSLLLIFPLGDAIDEIMVGRIRLGLDCVSDSSIPVAEFELDCEQFIGGDGDL